MFIAASMGNNLNTIGKMDKLWYINTVEYYSAMKKNELLTPIHTSMNVSQKRYDGWKSPDTKEHLLSYSIYMTFKNR